MIAFRLASASILEVESIAPYGRSVTSRHMLDEVLGNSNGVFDTNGQRFSLSAKEVTLLDSTLFAQLCRLDGSWVESWIEFRVEQQEITGNWTHRLFLRDEHSDPEKWPVSSCKHFSSKRGWNLRLQDTSYLLRDFLPPGSRSRPEDHELVTRAIDLNTRLGNMDGRFDALGRCFSTSARRVRLAGTVLHAELRTISGEWKEDQIDLGWMTEIWRLAEGMPAIQVPSCGATRTRSVFPVSLRLYAPLPPGREFIRVCFIQPGAWDEKIECRMVSRPVDLKESYKCLSYVWGSAQDEHRMIRVNSKSVSVTENLFTALRSLRSLGMAGAIWIDALCINQTNISERGSQVAMMASIYGKAQQVIIWLGELESAFRSLDLGFPSCRPRLLSILLSRFFSALDRDLHVNDAIREACSMLPSRLDLDPDSIASLSLITETCIRFVSMAWFTRTWTLQEYIFAQDAVFLVSNEVLGTETVKRALHNWARHRHDCCSKSEIAYEGSITTNPTMTDTNHPNALQEVARKIIHFEATYSLYEHLKEISRTACYPRALLPGGLISLDIAVLFLHEARRNKSSDPRDKVFAFTNIAVNAFGSFKPDYTLSVKQVYTSFTLRLVREMGNFDVWCLAEPSDKRPDASLTDIPSWAIDWSQDATSSATLRYQLKENTVGPSSTRWPYGELFRQVTDSIISVHAGRLDEVASISAHTAGGVYFNSWFQSGDDARAGLPPDREIILSWMRFVGIVDLDDARKQPARWDSLWRTVLGDHFPLFPYGIQMTEGNEYWRPLTSEDKEIVEQLVLKARMWPDGIPRARLSNSEQAVSDMIRINVYGRYLFTTPEGRLGLCPAQAQPKDVIFYIAGSRWPFLLRPNSATKDKQNGGAASSYRIIGACFVQGVSDDEVQAILEKGGTVMIS